ncbi:MAG: NAD(P)H-dependent oxidoreductase subunit E [Sporomusaceae bacterium]|jgi:NADH-quinone oxidoreductase subunit E|nr:NAD(P)H-dependent oxidoreductase subunit E [Sporomusaceae bacterium]
MGLTMTSEHELQAIKQYKKVIEIINQYEKSKEQLLSILMDIQETAPQNCITQTAAQIVAEELDLPLAKIYDILTFYAMFSTVPRGQYVVEICKSTPCHVTKADAVVKMFEEELGVKLGETTADNKFTLLHTSCVGACDIGPVAKIGEKVYGDLTREKVAEIVKCYKEGSLQCQKH